MGPLQGQLLFRHVGQQFGLHLGGLLEQFPALDKMHFKCIHIFGYHPIDDVFQADTSILRHQEKVKEGAQLVVIGTRGVGPSLIIACGHINLMEPNSEPLDGGYTVDVDILCPQLFIMEVRLQWRQLCLHNQRQHQCTHAQRGASRSEVKLGDGETQHIGEVY